MKYWHELTDKEVKVLVKAGKTWDYIIRHYKQLDWCNYHEALAGLMGCWKLVDFGMRKTITKNSCKNCDEYKAVDK